MRSDLHKDDISFGVKDAIICEKSCISVRKQQWCHAMYLYLTVYYAVSDLRYLLYLYITH